MATMGIFTRPVVGQHMGLLGGAVVREVAAQQQRVGGFGCLREEGARFRRNPW
jgi:hypothetical protein